jgi:glycolate oxidase FAD binding subunit
MALEAFQAIVGGPHARPATQADAVDGVTPALVVAPASVAEVAACLRSARERGLAVVPRGGGSKLCWGAPLERADVSLSTARLDRVLEHAAGDLVVRAQAGVPLAALQSRLATEGQWLALDPPEPGATLGGIVASAASGPRRHRYGTARDLLIGVTVVLADGLVAKAGGKVVKNVAGYDLCKLFSGSFGTLGVVVETAFRLHPLRSSRALVVVDLAGPEALGPATQALLNTALVPSAVELCWCEARHALAVLFESGAAGVAAQAEQALELLRRHGSARTLGGEALDDEWSRWTRTAPGRATLEVAVTLARAPEAIAAATAVAESQGCRVGLRGRAGLGVLIADLDGTDAGLAGFVRGLRERLGGEAHVMLRRAPSELRRAVAAWGDLGDALPLMQRIKERFDPSALLCPGRFAAGV